MDNYALQTFLKGAIDNAKERVGRNYKTAIPQYYRDRIQVLLPLCITNAQTADLAVTGARIYTLNPQNAVVSAMAVKDGKIVAVGADEPGRRFDRSPCGRLYERRVDHPDP